MQIVSSRADTRPVDRRRYLDHSADAHPRHNAGGSRPLATREMRPRRPLEPAMAAAPDDRGGPPLPRGRADADIGATGAGERTVRPPRGTVGCPRTGRRSSRLRARLPRGHAPGGHGAAASTCGRRSASDTSHVGGPVRGTLRRAGQRSTASRRCRRDGASSATSPTRARSARVKGRGQRRDSASRRSTRRATADGPTIQHRDGRRARAGDEEGGRREDRRRRRRRRDHRRRSSAAATARPRARRSAAPPAPASCSRRAARKSRPGRREPVGEADRAAHGDASAPIGSGC